MMNTLPAPTNNVLTILRREYLELTEDFCAAKLIEYFKHWTNWKLANHRTHWIYQPLKKIYADLMGEHSLHVIRRAIAILESMGIIKKQNNPGNGQDKTYQYMLQTDVLGDLLAEHRKCKTEEPECKNEHSEFNVETHHRINPKDPDPLSPDPLIKSEKRENELAAVEENLSDLTPDWDAVAEQTDLWEQNQTSNDPDIDPNHADKPKQVDHSSDSNPELDSHSAASPTPKIPKPRTTKQLEKEVWEIAPNHPYPVFLNWRADKKYKPQGGKWAEDAYGNAYSEFYNNRQKTTAVLFPEFLEYLKTVSGNCNELRAQDMKALLPSCFVMRPEATEENVQQLMRNIYQLAEKGVTVALPQGIATPSCKQSMSFEQAQDRTIAPLKAAARTTDQSPQMQAVIRYLESGNEPAARAIALRHGINLKSILEH